MQLMQSMSLQDGHRKTRSLMHTTHARRAEESKRDGDRTWGAKRVFWAVLLVDFDVVQERRLLNLISLSRARFQRALSREARPSAGPNATLGQQDRDKRSSSAFVRFGMSASVCPAEAA